MLIATAPSPCLDKVATHARVSQSCLSTQLEPTWSGPRTGCLLKFLSRTLATLRIFTYAIDKGGEYSGKVGLDPYTQKMPLGPPQEAHLYSPVLGFPS